MTAVQTELFQKRAPKVSAGEVERFCAILAAAGLWVSRKSLGSLWLEQTGETLPERKARQLAALAGFRVLGYPGSPGYRSWQSATIEEINHAANSLEAQGKAMIARANAYRIAYHQQRRAG